MGKHRDTNMHSPLLGGTRGALDNGEINRSCVLTVEVSKGKTHYLNTNTALRVSFYPPFPPPLLLRSAPSLLKFFLPSFSVSLSLLPSLPHFLPPTNHGTKFTRVGVLWVSMGVTGRRGVQCLGDERRVTRRATPRATPRAMPRAARVSPITATP